MFEKNLKTLEQINPYLFYKINLQKKSINNHNILIHNAKLNGKYIELENKKTKEKKYLHSKYDSLFEAKQFAKINYKKDTAIYICIGLGLGYHIRELLSLMNENQKLIIVSPDISLFNAVLEKEDFTDIFYDSRAKIFVDSNYMKITEQIKSFLFDQHEKKIKIFLFNSFEKLCLDFCKNILNDIENFCNYYNEEHEKLCKSANQENRFTYNKNFNFKSLSEAFKLNIQEKKEQNIYDKMLLAIYYIAAYKL